MLTPSDGFEGGEFCTSEPAPGIDPDKAKQWITTAHEFGCGDAIVFRSNQHHSVNPVKAGVRQTLVLELWTGSECIGRHRCMNPDCSEHKQQETKAFVHDATREAFWQSIRDSEGT